MNNRTETYCKSPKTRTPETNVVIIDVFFHRVMRPKDADGIVSPDMSVRNLRISVVLFI